MEKHVKEEEVDKRGTFPYENRDIAKAKNKETDRQSITINHKIDEKQIPRPLPVILTQRKGLHLHCKLKVISPTPTAAVPAVPITGQ